MFIGIDGGGTKTAFALVDARGRVLARHQEGSLYYLEVGLEAVEHTLRRGLQATLSSAGLGLQDLHGAYVGLPAFGEDSALQPQLEALAARALSGVAHGCGCDMHCSWAGALGGSDGIVVIAGTGSMAYGEAGGLQARAGGWGELFGDEGSAYWIAREGLTLFARMSDGRCARGPLHALVREHFRLGEDLDLCACIYGDGPEAAARRRSAIAHFAPLVSRAAESGDHQAQALFDRAAGELCQLVLAVRSRLRPASDSVLRVSYTGGLFAPSGRLLPAFEAALQGSGQAFQLALPRLSPELGAAWLAARAGGAPLDTAAMARLEAGC